MDGQNVRFGWQDVLGILNGGQAQVDTAALSVKLAALGGQKRQELLDKLRAYGNKVGPRIGGDFFSAFSEGAQNAASRARANRAYTLVGGEIVKSSIFLYGVLALAAVGIFWVMRK